MLEDSMLETGRLGKEFDSFLRMNDPGYEKRINFIINYNQFENSYNIDIHPAQKGFDSKAYFMFHFETEKGQDKIAKFAKENNIGLIRY